MRPLPILSNISDLAFGLSTQLKMGEPIAIDNSYKFSSYETVIQYAFKIDSKKCIIIYSAFKSEPHVDFMVDVTQLYQIVRKYFGGRFNGEYVATHLHEFADAFTEKDKEAIFSLSFIEVEKSIMLSKRFHTGFFDSSEEFMMGIIGMLHGFVRNVYKDVIKSLPLPNEDRQYIYDVLTAIDTLSPES